MIIDCHTHVNCSTCPCDTVEFQEFLDKVDAALVMAIPEESNDKANEKVSKFISPFEKAYGFAVVNPLKDSISKSSLNHLKDKLGFKGFVLYCPEFNMHPCHSKAMQFYELAEKMEMPVYFHNSGPYSSDAVLDYAQPYPIDEIARNFKKLKIVISSLGYPFVRQAFCLLQKNDNVYSTLNVSSDKPWELYNFVTGAYEAQVMDKLLFGSGFPQGSINENLEALLGFKRIYADTQLPTVPREAIRGVVERNSLEVLGIA